MNHVDDLLTFIEGYQAHGSAGRTPYLLDQPLRQAILDTCQSLQKRGLAADSEALQKINAVLANIYEYRFSLPGANAVDIDVSSLFSDVCALLEPVILEAEIAKIPADIFDQLPTTSEAFVEWLKQYIIQHPAGSHAFFNYLKDEASREGMKMFLAQETTLDPRFDDILALMQVGVTGAEKMEIAKNYFDEMGNGQEDEVHTVLFSKALTVLGIDQSYIDRILLPEALLCGNLSACLALSSRHHYKAIGYFGVTEFLAPRRFKKMVAGWRRLGLPEAGVEYHDLHIRVDAIHGKGWFDNAIEPAARRDPALIKEILFGALIRLSSSQAYLDRLLQTVTGLGYVQVVQPHVDSAVA